MKRIPEALAEAIESRRLVVFCGAGISMGAPSCLPDWWTLNQLVLDEARRAALSELPSLRSETRACIDSLSLDDLPLVGFSETLVKTFAGSSWFGVLGVLDSDSANSTHRALADLARQKLVRALVSTNFDTLIERAFREAAVPLLVFSDSDDYRRLGSADSCALYKIHGSAKETDSIVDTVSQKLRGLSGPARDRLAELARLNHVLVLGYSGADLAFSEDYLGLGDVLGEGPGLTWLMRPGSDVTERVERLVAAAGKRGAAVEGSLPAFLGELGAIVEPTPEPDASVQERANRNARRAIEQWLAEAHIGPLVCGVYLARLLSLIGKAPEARSLRKQIGAHPEVAGDAVPITAQVVCGALAADSIEDRDFDGAKAWLHRQLEIARGISQLYAHHGYPMPPDVETEQARNMASTWMNLAVCAEASGEYDEAKRALELALPLAEAGGHRGVMASVQLKYAEIESAEGAHLDTVLTRLRGARVDARAAGDVALLLDVELLMAQAYVDLAEYDCALAALERAAGYANLSADYRPDLARRYLHAVVALRRGRPDHALDELSAVIQDAVKRGDVDHADRFRFQLCLMLASDGDARPRVLDEIDDLIERHSGDATPPVSVEVLGELRRLITSADAPTLPPFLLDKPDDEEGRTRYAIRELEFSQALDELAPAFAHLCMVYDGRQSARRLLEIAQGQLQAAERAGRHDQRLTALNWLGIAHDVLGELDEAVRAYRTALDGDPPPARGLLPRLRHNLAVTLGRRRDYGAAAELFAQAAAGFEALGERADESRSRAGVAQALFRGGEPERALEVATDTLALAETVEEPHLASTARELITRIEVALAAEGDSADANAPLDLPQLAPQPVPTDLSEGEARTTEDLGNLSLVEWQAGEREAAWAHSRQAMAGYAAREDRLGVSRCLNNQAGFAAAVEDWEGACRLAKEALALRVGVGDIPGQIQTLANIAHFELGRGHQHAAIAAASRSLALAEDARVDAPAVYACLALIHAYTDLGDDVQALAAVRRCLALAAHVDGPQFEELRAQLEPLVAAPTPSSAPEPAPDRFEDALAEATRLAKLADVEGTTAVLDSLRAPGLTPYQLGCIEGTLGNALQNADRHDEADAAYRRAAELFGAAGDVHRAGQATRQRTVSLRRSGRLSEAERVLREAIASSPSPEGTRQAETMLANTLVEHYRMSTELDQSLLDEARALLTKAAAETSEIEVRGVALVGLANVEQLAGEPAEGAARLREGLSELRRVNSRHVGPVEEALARLEAMLDAEES